MRSLATWCVRHRRIVVTGWLVVLIALTAISQSVGTRKANSVNLSGTQSAAALGLLQRVAPKASGDREQIVVAVTHGRVTDHPVRTQVNTMLAKIAALRYVASVASPYSPAGSAQVSRSGQVEFANVTLNKQAASVTTAQAKRFVAAAQTAATNGVQVGIEGQVASAANPISSSTTALGGAAALVVMVLVFGSLLAALLPLLTAGVALGTSTALIGLVSHLLAMASFASELSLLIGLGVGVDYGLFIVTRFRQGLQRGLPAERAIVDSLDTSGRAVMFAGITVCIALLGMFALGVSFLYGVALAASIAVLCTVVAALTLLPALLGFLGTRALGRRDRRNLAGGHLTLNDESPTWTRWANTLRARPALSATAAAALLAIVAIPFFSMRLGSSDAGTDPAGSTTRQAYDLLAKGFGPGYNGPLQLVAQVDNPAQDAAFATVTAAVAKTGGVVRVTAPTLIAGHDGKPSVATADVYASGSPQDASTTTLLNRLRNHVVPASTSHGLHVLIGGQTATSEDFAHVLTSKLPLFIALVVLLSFFLLTAVFRTLLIPAISALMNLLTAGAAFGLITAVFQWGWAASLLGIATGPIDAFAPVLMFAIVFGLSMDYQVFLVTRIYEEWHRRGDNREAVTHGLAATGKTISAAAIIMILIFASFILGGERIIALFGIGLAGAVVIDALIVRSILVPSLMLLAGKANWWCPPILDRILPHLQRRRKQPTTTSQANTPPGGSSNNQSRRNDGSSAGASAPSLQTNQLFPPLTEAQLGRRHRDLLCNPHGGAGGPARPGTLPCAARATQRPAPLADSWLAAEPRCARFPRKAGAPAAAPTHPCDEQSRSD